MNLRSDEYIIVFYNLHGPLTYKMQLSTFLYNMCEDFQ